MMPDNSSISVNKSAYYNPLRSFRGYFSHAGLWATAIFQTKIYHSPYCSIDLPDSDRVVIYCVHGMADSSASFTTLINRLLDRELPANIASIHLMEFDNRGRGYGIPYFSEALSEKINKNRHKNIILLGHSRGGLIAAHYAENWASHSGVMIHGIFPICSPFGGSPWALNLLALISRSVNEMQPDAVFLKELREKIVSSEYSYHYISAECDGLVPLDSTFIKENSKSITLFDQHGHLSILYSNRLVEHLRLCLREILTPKNNLADVRNLPDEDLQEEQKNGWEIVSEYKA